MKRERIKKISLVSVTQSFLENEKVLDNVSFDLPLGKSVALFGSPGSGKSLALKIIAGLVEPTSGEVIYNDKNIKELTFEEFTPMRLSTAICFENGGLLMNKTLEENLKISLLYHKQWRTERGPQLFEELTTDFKITSFLHLRPAQISEGVRRLAGIVRAFLQNPQILFLDEPSLGIGEESIETLKKWIKKHRNEYEDAAVFVTTQDSKLIESIDVEKWVLENGQLKKTG